MSTFIKLTRKNTTGEAEVVVNIANITFLQWSKEYEVTRVHFNNSGENKVISVVETVDEISKLFK